ncbi:MAG TPA: hypothetical protein VNE62_06925 [Actinomycetota bacterium]|nr:hypothetical protein [Actinomycetota bacterium]
MTPSRPDEPPAELTEFLARIQSPEGKKEFFERIHAREPALRMVFKRAGIMARKRGSPSQTTLDALIAAAETRWGASETELAIADALQKSGVAAAARTWLDSSPSVERFGEPPKDWDPRKAGGMEQPLPVSFDLRMTMAEQGPTLRELVLRLLSSKGTDVARMCEASGLSAEDFLKHLSAEPPVGDDND